MTTLDFIFSTFSPVSTAVLFKSKMYHDQHQFTFCVGAAMSTEFLNARKILLYDTMTRSHYGNMTKIELYLKELMESSTFKIASSLLSSLAIVPYVLFIIFTVSNSALARPKNIFKSNFAASAIVSLIH